METPLQSQEKLAKAVGVKNLFFKREDLHPYGSHKGRSIPNMIEHYLKSGDQRFAISSSGNAALAAALYVKALNQKSDTKPKPIELDIFIGQHAAPHKTNRLKGLADDHIRVFVKERPRQALTEAINAGSRSLRQSTDDIALIGYKSLAEEITQELSSQKKPLAIFIGTSSGTTAQALAQYFLEQKIPAQIHIVQTSSCHLISQEFESFDGPGEDSIADAIVDIIAHRKSTLVPLIEKTNGYGWTVTNQEIQYAQELTQKETSLSISTNSALSVAGLLKAVSIGYELPPTVICLICGE